MQIGRAKTWRESRGLTQRELAKEAGVGEVTVARFENGSSVTVPTARKVAQALGVTVIDLMDDPPAPAPKAPAPKPTGPLDQILGRTGARTRHLADEGLVTGLETAGDVEVSRTVREIRAELALLLPELRRLRGRVKPGDPDFMPTNRAIGDAAKQVFILTMWLRQLDGQEPQAVALAEAGQELRELAVA